MQMEVIYIYILRIKFNINEMHNSSFGHIIHDFKTIASLLHESISIMLGEKEIMLLIDSLEELGLLALFLFGWSMFLQMFLLYTILIYI